jgi:hypothetical protein
MYSFRYNLILIFYLGLNLTHGHAQDSATSQNIEQKSYQLYLDKKWPELIAFGRQAIKSGTEYFYLDMRIGVAYYERKNYSSAETFFKKALKFNSADNSALEYLYYCYVYTGQYEASRMLSKKFGPELAKKIGSDSFSPTELVMIEGGVKKSDSSSYYDRYRKANSLFFDPAIYFQLGVKHYVKNRISAFHSVTYFNQRTFLGSNRQIQYYLKVNVPLKNDWLISPAFDWVNRKSEVRTGPPPPPNQMGPPPRPKMITVKTNNFVGSLSIQKTIKKFNVSVGTTISNLDSDMQYIHFGNLSFKPFGNSRLIIGCTEYIHTSDNYSTVYSAVSPFLFVQPINRISVSLSYFQNKGNNIIEGNGYLVNNSADLTTSRWSGLLNVNITKHVSLYGLYQLEYKTESTHQFNYHYNVIVGGIKITP